MNRKTRARNTRARKTRARKTRARKTRYMIKGGEEIMGPGNSGLYHKCRTGVIVKLNPFSNKTHCNNISHSGKKNVCEIRLEKPRDAYGKARGLPSLSCLPKNKSTVSVPIKGLEETTDLDEIEVMKGGTADVNHNNGGGKRKSKRGKSQKRKSQKRKSKKRKSKRGKSQKRK